MADLILVDLAVEAVVLDLMLSKCLNKCFPVLVANVVVEGGVLTSKVVDSRAVVEEAFNSQAVEEEAFNSQVELAGSQVVQEGLEGVESHKIFFPRVDLFPNLDNPSFPTR